MLHFVCDICFTVGHHHKVHFDPIHQLSSLELRQLYFANMSNGAWTSLPLLSLDPEMAKKLTGRHWFFSYDGVRFRHATITRFALRVGPNSIQFGDHNDPERERQHNDWLKEEYIRRDFYRQRICAKDPSEIQPLPRHAIRRMVVAKAKEAKDKKRMLIDQRKLRKAAQKPGQQV